MDALKYDSNGLLTAVAQDINTGQVLMVAMMNAEAVEMTLKTKRAHFWSRSRKKLWQKGETSGNFLQVQEIKIDCDRDALLLQVIPLGPACHTGNMTCFYSDLDGHDVA
ncbi:MAG: phosphoribosyl-AMP cyclohydrolase [Chloroflexota bacterium]|nr:MAG: phosphoribosyl-AMP cyclohydrolase [Chloroflexota bacterium]